jgi:hypothetical protein
MRRASLASLLAFLVWVPTATAQVADPIAVPGEAEASGSASVEGSASFDGGVAGGAGQGFGVGPATMLGSADGLGLVGPGIVYDTAVFHIEALIAFARSDANTNLGIGGRFWYHLHRSERADFSLGGGLGLLSLDSDPGDSAMVFDLEGGGEVRLWLVENVSLSAALGLVVLAGDGDGVDLVGDLTGAGALTYFF